VKYLIQKGSTKNVFMILVAILLVGGAFLLAEYRNKQTENIYTNTIIEKPNYNENIESDIDWKKILLVNDYATTSGSTGDSNKVNEKLTATDLLGRDFFARYMELRQMGGANDKLSQEQLVTEILESGVMLSTPKIYTVADILIKYDDNTDSLKKYGNDAGGIIKSNSISSRNEAIITKDAIDTDNMKILKELDPIIKSYRNTLTSLLKVQAPQSISNMHLDLVNSMSSLVFIAEGLRKVDVDPLAGIQAIARYTATMQQFAASVNNIKNKLLPLGIVYSTKEGGTFFLPN